MGEVTHKVIVCISSIYGVVVTSQNDHNDGDKAQYIYNNEGVLDLRMIWSNQSVRGGQPESGQHREVSLG